jgi:hypothetical protein
VSRFLAAVLLGLLVVGCAQAPGGSTQSQQNRSDEKRGTDFKSGTY